MCNAACEDRDHLLTCPDPDVTNVLNKGIKDLEKIMKEKETHIKLTRCIYCHREIGTFKKPPFSPRKLKSILLICYTILIYEYFEKKTKNVWIGNAFL